MKLSDLLEAKKSPFKFKHLPKFLKAAQKKLADIEEKKKNFTGEYDPKNPEEKRLAQEARAAWDGMEDSELWVVALCTQCAVESGNFTQREENLKYSASRLREVFPRITAEEAKKLVKGGKKAIANYIYRNKNGNKDENDGWKYRGRGWIQLTGKENYMRSSQSIFGDDRLVDDPSLAAEDDYINKIAIDYFQRRVIGKADPFDVEAVTGKVNAARVGLQDRINKFEDAVADVTTSTGSAA